VPDPRDPRCGWDSPWVSMWVGFDVGFAVGGFCREWVLLWVSLWVGFAVGGFFCGSSLSGTGFRPLG
jgi:hypothetical protein